MNRIALGLAVNMTPSEFRWFWARSHGHANIEGVVELDFIQCRRIAWSYTIIDTEVEL